MRMLNHILSVSHSDRKKTLTKIKNKGGGACDLCKFRVFGLMSEAQWRTFCTLVVSVGLPPSPAGRRVRNDLLIFISVAPKSCTRLVSHITDTDTTGGGCHARLLMCTCTLKQSEAVKAVSCEYIWTRARVLDSKRVKHTLAEMCALRFKADFTRLGHPCHPATCTLQLLVGNRSTG